MRMHHDICVLHVVRVSGVELYGVNPAEFASESQRNVIPSHSSYTCCLHNMSCAVYVNHMVYICLLYMRV